MNTYRVRYAEPNRANHTTVEAKEFRLAHREKVYEFYDNEGKCIAIAPVVTVLYIKKIS